MTINLSDPTAVFKRINTFYNNFCWIYLGLDDGGNERKSFRTTEIHLCDTWRAHVRSTTDTFCDAWYKSSITCRNKYRCSEPRRERFNWAPKCLATLIVVPLPMSLKLKNCFCLDFSKARMLPSTHHHHHLSFHTIFDFQLYTINFEWQDMTRPVKSNDIVT